MTFIFSLFELSLFLSLLISIVYVLVSFSSSPIVVFPKVLLLLSVTTNGKWNVLFLIALINFSFES